MPDSKYYNRLYKEKRDAVRGYDDNLTELRRIQSNLNNSVSGEVYNVNSRIDFLSNYLGQAVRYNSGFDTTKNSLPSKREPSVESDAKLVTVSSEIDEEITRITNLKNTAADQRDYYYSQYKAKKDEEIKEFWDNIF